MDEPGLSPDALFVALRASTALKAVVPEAVRPRPREQVLVLRRPSPQVSFGFKFANTPTGHVIAAVDPAAAAGRAGLRAQDELVRPGGGFFVTFDSVVFTSCVCVLLVAGHW
jgi:predicted metalloprotease with PDZ domain